MARIQAVLVHIDLFTEMITQDWVIGLHEETERVYCTKGIPPGAKLVGVTWDPSRQCLQMVYEHDSFEDVPAGKYPKDVLMIEFGRQYRPLHTHENLSANSALTSQSKGPSLSESRLFVPELEDER